MAKSLLQWLEFIEQSHPIEQICLGLERVQQVYQSMALSRLAPLMITVGGTNGKGTTVAALSALLQSQGNKVGCYTSPHLFHFRERIRVNDVAVADECIAEGFQSVADHCHDAGLTYFEWTTLAAFQVLKQQQCDVLLLEVGLGGRLDAVNVVDSDISIITNVDLDHCDFLGDDREEIGQEKAGILRSQQRFIYGDHVMPNSVLAAAKSLSIHPEQLGNTFQSLGRDENHWSYRDVNRQMNSLPRLSGLHKNNLATALYTFLSLYPKATEQSIKHALSLIQINGRCQWLDVSPAHLIDVGHNIQAIDHLLSVIAQREIKPVVLLGMLKGKPLSYAIDKLLPVARQLILAPLYAQTSRGFQYQELLAEYGHQDSCQLVQSLQDGYELALEIAADEPCQVVICGSFYTVQCVESLYS